MDFFNGLYLGNEICAFSGDWFVVWDGKFNYMLFNSSHPTVLSRGTNGWMPRNTFERKLVEFYSNFDNAVDNLVNVVANGGFLKFAKVVK